MAVADISHGAERWVGRLRSMPCFMCADIKRITTSEDRTFSSDSYAHYLHHKYFECNYADGILPLDKWFGTFHDGSEEAQERLRYRLKEKLRKPQTK